jgi:capsular exopolysaccharide synthesis family protein
MNEKNILAELQNDEFFDGSINVRQYWHVILERRWLVVAVFLVISFLTAFHLFTATLIFSSTSRLQIDRETENSLRMESFVMDGSGEQDYLQTQYKNLQSRTIFKKVLSEIIENASILSAIDNGKNRIEQIVEQTKMPQDEIVKRLYQLDRAGFFGLESYEGGDAPNLFKEENRPLSKGLFVFQSKSKDKPEAKPSEEELLKLISGATSVSPIRLSRLVDVRVESPNRNEAAMIANTVVSVFLEQDNSRKRGKLSNAIEFLKIEANNLSKSVHENYMTLHEFKLRWDIISLEDTQNTTLQALLKAQDDFDSAHSQAVKLLAVSDEASRVFDETNEYGTIPEVAADISIKSTRASLALAKAELASLSERYLDKHPKIKEKKRSIEVLTDSLKSSEKRIFDSIINQAKLAKASDIQLAEVLTIRKSEQQSMNQKSIEYNNLARAATQSESMYNLALKRLKETELQEKDIVQNMHIIDLAAPEQVAVKPKKVLTAMLGITIGFVSGIGLVFFVNFLDDSIKSQEDIESYLKLNFLGYIPNIKTTSIIERDLQAHLHPQSNSAEAFRTIRAAISLSPRENELQIIAMTSTVPSEGKSLVASNHAIVTAQTGAKTLLVDCDLRRPSVHKAFQIQSPRGLTAYLLNKTDSIESITHETEVPNLDIICCGAVPNNPSELAGSQRMVNFIDDIRGKYQKIVLDCPPVSAVSDPLIIASGADGTVFVNKFNKIRREHALKTVRRVQDAGINILGVCINDLDFEGKDSYYYSYYYYQNRYYASHYKSDKSPEEDQQDQPVNVVPADLKNNRSNKSA